MPAAAHPAFKRPDNPSACIWRYMDFTKFVDMLDTASLFLARMDLLGDPFEGSFARENERQRQALIAELANKMPPEHSAKLTSHFRDSNVAFRRRAFVSCWHLNEAESAGMWRLYASTNEAIAVRSNVARLVAQLDETVSVGEVEYIDFETGWVPEGNVFFPFLHKRQSFAHERELRAIKMLWPGEPELFDIERPPQERGLRCPVSLPDLVEAVYVAPTAPEWFKDLVQRVSHRYGLSVPVAHSSLDAQPFF